MPKYSATDTAYYQVQIKPFDVPEKVELANGSTVPLNKVDAADLKKLCDRFRKDVFRIAGKQEQNV